MINVYVIFFSNDSFNIPLSKNQIKLLSKGLKFTLTPKPNIPGTKRAIEDFTRKLRLKEFFCR